MMPERPAGPRQPRTADLAMKKLQIVQENGFCKVRGEDSPWTITATIQVTPGAKNTPAESTRTRQVLVVRGMETLVGRTKDEGTGNEWSYKLLSRNSTTPAKGI